MRHKRPYVMWSHLYKISRIGKSINTEGTSVVALGLRAIGDRDLKAKSFCWDDNILKLAVAMVVHYLWMYYKLKLYAFN